MKMIPEVDISTKHVTSLTGEIGVGWWCDKSDSFYFNFTLESIDTNRHLHKNNFEQIIVKDYRKNYFPLIYN